jgi:hypothetical protein
MHTKTIAGVVMALGLCLPSFALAQHALENPQPNSHQSGVSLISGWKCTAGTVTVRFDGGAPIPVTYGTPREDTVARCGDDNNGFGLLWNWNLLGDGPHVVDVLDEGVVFASATITVTTFGEEFLAGEGGGGTVNFAGKQVAVKWSERHQNFVIIGVGPQGVVPNVAGTWAYHTVPIGSGCLQGRDEVIFRGTLELTQMGTLLTGTQLGVFPVDGTVDIEGNFSLVISGTAEIPFNEDRTCTGVAFVELKGNFLAQSIEVTSLINFTGSCPGLADCRVRWEGIITEASGTK